MMPVNDKIAALVTAMHSANIQSTMCDANGSCATARS